MDQENWIEAIISIRTCYILVLARMRQQDNDRKLNYAQKRIIEHVLMELDAKSLYKGENDIDAGLDILLSNDRKKEITMDHQIKHESQG